MSNKQKTAPKAKKPSTPTPSKTEGGRLPFLVEASFTFARIIVVLVAAIEAVLSLQAGAPPLVVALRTGVAIAVVGLGLWLISWIISGGSLGSTPASSEEASASNPQAPSSTMQINA